MVNLGSEEAGEDDYQKSGLGTELASESEIKKDWPVRFGGESETELGKDLPTRSFESETGKDSPTVFGGKLETVPGDDSDQKIESIIGNDGGKLGTELSPAKSHEFEQTIGSEIGEDNGAGKPGTERREDFLGKSYEFDQEIESAFGKDSPTRLPQDENFPTRSDGLGKDLPTETDDDHFSPEFSGPKERDDFDSQEVKPTTYSEMIGSATGETVADKLATKDENVKETASPVKTKLSFSGDGREADETEKGEDKFVPARDHLEEKKLTPEEEEDKAFSDMVAEKLNLGGEIKEEAAVEKIPSDKLPEEIKGGEAVEEEGKGGIVGTIKGVYNYWLGGTEEVKPKSPSSVDESSQPLSSTVGKTNSSFDSLLMLFE